MSTAESQLFSWLNMYEKSAVSAKHVFVCNSERSIFFLLLVIDHLLIFIRDSLLLEDSSDMICKGGQPSPLEFFMT